VGAALAAARAGARTSSGQRSGKHASPHSALQTFKHLKRDFSVLLRDRNFLRLMFAFGLGVGIFNGIITVMSQYLGPCGYDNTTAGIASGALLGAGLLSAAVMGYALERTKAYVPLLRTGIIGVCASLLFMLLMVRPGQQAVLIVAFALMGMCLVPLLPLSLENAAECTYPIPEDNTSALLLITGQMWGIVFILGLGALIQMEPSKSCSSVVTPAAGAILLPMLLAAAVLLTFKKDYRRTAAEKSRETQVDVVGFH
jgi:MFS family permease